MDERKIIQIDYTNWRGERRVREILPTGRLEFANTEYHHDTQWLLEAVDVEDGKIKLFAMKDIHSFGVTEPASPWRDIESAPKDGTYIDLWISNGERIPDARWNDRQRRWEVWSLGDYDRMEFVPIAGNPTHWMPLPEPPR